MDSFVLYGCGWQIQLRFYSAARLQLRDGFYCKQTTLAESPECRFVRHLSTSVLRIHRDWGICTRHGEREERETSEVSGYDFQTTFVAVRQ